MITELEWLKEFTSRLEIANDQVPEENYKFWDYMKQLRIKSQQRIEALTALAKKPSGVKK